MRKKIDPADGGLYFCWSKRGEVGLVPKSDKVRYAAWKCSMCGKKPCDCNGKLLSPGKIDSYFSYLAQKRKKDKKGAGQVGDNREEPKGEQQEPGTEGVQDCEEVYNLPLTEDLPAGDDVGI